LNLSQPLTTLPNIAQAITEAAERLHAAGLTDERRTANSLLGQALGVDRIYLITHANDALGEAPYQAFLAMIERRATGEPLQYITGHQEFYGLDFCVTPDVLIPRPETEFLIEQVIKLSQSREEFRPTTFGQKVLPGKIPPEGGTSNPSTNQLVIVDAGTGSGCIAITLALQVKNARVIATDISPAALAVARENAQRLGAKDQIEFLEGDLLAPLAGLNLEGAVDFLASNPPYISVQDAVTLQREVKDWEPHTALFAANDGLKFYQRLLNEGQQYVKRDGFLICEIGYTQLDAIKRMIDTNLWQLEEVTNDLQGIPRTLTIRRG
jgi:release factor glutamine methyltransferase